MKVSSYIKPDEQEDNGEERDVWVELEDGDEYDIQVIKEDGEWTAGQMENVIADRSIGSRDTEVIQEMKEISIDVVKSIESINSDY